MSESLPAGLKTEEYSSSIRPQDDLYRYVNGTWLDETEIPEDKARWGAFNQLAEQAEADVREIIESAAKAVEAGTATGDEAKIGALFNSFMDAERAEKLGTAPIQKQLAAVDQITTVPELLKALGEADRSGVASAIGFYVEPDPGNPKRKLPFITQSGISLPDESYYREDSFAEIRSEFRKHVERMLRLAGVENPDAEAERIVTLETEIASNHWDNVRTRDAVASYNPMSWSETVALAGVDLNPWLAGVSNNRPELFTEVVINQPSFVESFAKLFTKEHLEQWKAWLRWHIIRSASPYLSEDFVNENFAFVGTTLSGIPVLRERWKRGVSVVDSALGEAVGREYVAKHYPPDAKAQMDVLVHNLIEAYRASITNLEWMSPETRERALEKLDKFTPKVGHPEQWRDYSALEISADDLLGNMRSASEFAHDRELEKIADPTVPDDWFMTPQTVNAYYHPLMNEIVFPAAILQPPFFDPHRDAAANYGGIGAVIGHEIGHGFDDQGSRYDGDGALRDWWSDDDRAAFEERTGALIAQYNELVPLGLNDEHHVNGALTIGENIGDLGGLGIAIKAYQLSLNGGEDPVIDGLTGLQRLLLSWAQVWQQKSRDENAIQMLAVDPHSPNEFRCNQIVRNLDEFYNEFDVKESDALWLAPEERVTIW